MSEGPINLKSLKEQVYIYLSDLIQKKELRAGSMINMEEFSRKLGISKTPLRDALIQLEMDGFVTIAPRKGIYVNSLSLGEIKEFYQILGALEATALEAFFPLRKHGDWQRMENLNSDMGRAIENGDFDRFHLLNLEFHRVYLGGCGNKSLFRIVENLKKRLYDFPKQSNWVKEWEVASIAEHATLVNLLKENQIVAACRHIRDIHWSFQVQARFIQAYYFPDRKADHTHP